MALRCFLGTVELFAFYAIESTPKFVQIFHFVALMIIHFGEMNKTQIKKSFDGGE